MHGEASVGEYSGPKYLVLFALLSFACNNEW